MHAQGSVDLALLFLAIAQPAAAEGPVTIATMVPYATGAVGRESIRTECKWNSDLPAAIVAQSDGSVVATDQDLASVHGKKLVMVVTHMHAMAGMWFRRAERGS